MLEVQLGIAGTAKNTGKTTTTAAILNELRSRGINIYLTSIGYDGENLDNITGLPKPKLQVLPGDIVATARKCADTSTAKLKIIDETAIRTPLGKVLIAKVLSPGLVVTAGPNKSTEVKELRQYFSQMGPGVTIFDGALSRIAPMAETDGIILATGAARTTNIPALSLETEMMWRVANLPLATRAMELAKRNTDRVTLFDSDLQELSSRKFPSLFSESDVRQMFHSFDDDEGYLHIPGIITERALSAIYTIFAENEKRLFLTFADPIKLLTAGNLVTFYALLDKLYEVGVFVGVLRRVPLFAVTVNPFYPEYRFETRTYAPAYIDFVSLEVAIKRRIAVPVYNVARQGAKRLVDIVMTNAHVWENPQHTVYFD